MTARRRSIALAALILMLPACLHLEPTTYPTPPDQAPKPTALQSPETAQNSQFAVLPSRPGTVIPLKPNDKDQVAQRLPETPLEQLPRDDSEVVTAGKVARPAPETPLLSAIHAYEEGKPDRAIEFLSLLERPNQELVLAMLPVLTRGATLDLRDPVATAILTDQIRNAASRIEPGAALKLDTVTLCANVIGYGMYEPLPKGQPYRRSQLAELYIEVRNMGCQPAVGPNGENFVIPYLTITEIRDSNNRLVDQLDPANLSRLTPVVQTKHNRYCRSPIHDFHILYQFQAPATPGVYTIAVAIQDPITKRTIKTPPVQFLVAGP